MAIKFRSWIIFSIIIIFSIPTIQEEEKDMVKRWHLSSTDSANWNEAEFNPQSKYYYNSQYIEGHNDGAPGSERALIYSSSTFGTWGSAAYSETSLTTATSPVFYEESGGNLYAAYGIISGGTVTIKMTNSADGDSWGAATSFNPANNYLRCGDYFKISSTRYIMAEKSGSMAFFKEDGTEVDTLTITGFAAGWSDGTDYYFVASPDATSTKVYTFDGTNITVYETISSTTQMTDQHTNFQGYFWKADNGSVWFLVTRNNGTGVTSILRKVGGVWGNVLYSETNDPGYIVTKDAHDSVKYIIYNIGSGNRDVYYITPAGSLIKIISTTTNIQTGWDDRLGNGVVGEVSISVKYCNIQGSHLASESCRFHYLSTGFAKGDGVVLTDDSDNVKFIGNIIGVQDRISTEIIDCLSPAIYDLRRKITVSYTAKTAEFILEDILDNYCQFLYDDFSTTPGGSYTISFNEVSIGTIFEWIERTATYIIYWDEYGAVSFDNGGTASGTTVTQSNTDTPDIRAEGSFNAITLDGGLKSDATLATVTVYDPKAGDQQINLFRDVYPYITDDAASGVLETLAQAILDSRDSAFKRYQFNWTQKGKPVLGQTIDFSNAKYSVSNENIIVMSFSWDLEADYGFLECYSGLMFNTLFRKNLPESNREILSQLTNAVYTQSQIDAIIQDLTQLANWHGDNGFALAAASGHAYGVASSDTNARINIKRRIMLAGNYKLTIISSESAGDNVNGTVNVGAAQPDENRSLTNKINAAAMNITHDAATDYAVTQSASFAVAAGDIVGANWAKNDNTGAGTFYVHDVYFEKQ